MEEENSIIDEAERKQQQYEVAECARVRTYGGRGEINGVYNSYSSSVQLLYVQRSLKHRCEERKFHHEATCAN